MNGKGIKAEELAGGTFDFGEASTDRPALAESRAMRFARIENRMVRSAQGIPLFESGILRRVDSLFSSFASIGGE